MILSPRLLFKLIIGTVEQQQQTPFLIQQLLRWRVQNCGNASLRVCNAPRVYTCRPPVSNLAITCRSGISRHILIYICGGVITAF